MPQARILVDILDSDEKELLVPKGEIVEVFIGSVWGEVMPMFSHNGQNIVLLDEEYEELIPTLTEGEGI